MLRLSDRTVDLTRGVVRAADEELRLTTKEIQLLVYFAERPGRVVPRDVLLVEVWGYRPTAQTRAVDNMIRKVRVKIEADPCDPVHLLTVFGEGYRFDPVPVRAKEPSRTGTRVTPPSFPEFGRDDLVARLESWLANGRRCLCLVGPAGVGKSTVARRVALNSTRAGGAWWCRVDDAVGARELELRVCAGIGATEAGLERALQASPSLLVLDGCDALDAEAEEAVGAWIARFPGLDVVATTRLRRFGRFGTVLEVPPLDPAASRALLDGCVARVRPDRPLTEAEAEALLERLEGWPVAIELAGARLRFLSGEEVARRLDVSLLELLRDPSAGVSRSLEAALRATVQSLDPGDRRVLARCTVFCGDFSPADAEIVVGEPDVVDALHRLVDHSLLRAVADGRLGLLDPIRAVAAALLEVGEADSLRRRHLRRFVEIAEAAWVPPVSRHQARARREWDNMLAAWSFGLEVEPEAAGKLVLYVDRELGRRGHHHRRLLLLDRALATNLSPGVALALRITRLNVVTLLGEDAASVPNDLEALDPEVRAFGDPEVRAHLLLSRAQIARRRGDPAEAVLLCARATDTVAGIDAPYVYTRAWSALTLAGARVDQGRFDEAIQAYVHAGQLARTAGDAATEGQVLWGRGLLEVHRGRPAAAVPHLEDALARCGDEPRVRMDTLLVLARVAMGRGRAEETRRLCDEVRPHVVRSGDREREGLLAALASELHIDAGDFEAAEAELLAFERHTLTGHAVQEVYAAANLGRLYRLSGRTVRARERFEVARDLARVQARNMVAPMMVCLAAVRAELGDAAGASAALAEAETEGGADPVKVALARGHLAVAHARTAVGAEVDRWLAEARAIRDALAADPDVSLITRAELGHLSRDLGTVAR